jgi:hypothetical protein
VGIFVIVDNPNGKFTITRSPANNEPTTDRDERLP